MKKLFIAEKPSVAEEFAKVIGDDLVRRDGYREGEHCVVTWCFGHLVTMSYPDVYDQKYKFWRLETLPFLPEKYLYEVINQSSSRKQFHTVKKLLNRQDIDIIYVCTDSGREGEYIYRLVRQMAGVQCKDERRVWINSQTEEEIQRGIAEAKPLSEYDHLSDAAYLRAKEDYLMGINFSRLLTLKYGNALAHFLDQKRCVVAVGRVMTCVLGMVTRREQEIRNFKKTPYYRLVARISGGAGEITSPSDTVSSTSEDSRTGEGIECEWKAVEGSRYFESPVLYKENGFKKEEDARKLLGELQGQEAVVDSVSRKQERKNAPSLFNLAELQNECTKLFKIAPNETLAIAQELYEKKMTTYPRTDARVLSSAVAKEIQKNIRGLTGLSALRPFAEEILASAAYKKIRNNSRYVNDSKITDHYAIIPTGAALSALAGLKPVQRQVYEVIARRFLAIFLPQAVYRKTALVLDVGGEKFFASEKILTEPGYLAVMDYSFTKKRSEKSIGLLDGFRKGKKVSPIEMDIRLGETTPPKRYTTGSMILAMENAGKLIEDESLREQIQGSGIGTSATRAEILDKLIRIDYLRKNAKTQTLAPSMQGEMIYFVVGKSIATMLNPEFTAGWERGLTMVNDGKVTEKEYMMKLSDYIRSCTGRVMSLHNDYELKLCFQYVRECHKDEKKIAPGKAAKRRKRK